MISWIFHSLRPYHAAVFTLCRADVALQLVSVWLICALVWGVGHKEIAVVVGICLSISEWVIHQIVTKKPAFQLKDRDHTVLMLLALCSFNSFLYAAPAILLALSASVALKLSSVLWLLGMNFYIANIWARVPPLLFAMLIPPLLIFIVAFALLPMTAPSPSPMWHWIASTGLLGIYIYIAVEALQQHFKLERDLFHTQEQSKRHLAKLENSHRIDPLTGVLNRPAFDRALAVLLEERVLLGTEVAVFMVDLDGFKPINDTYSHQAGDTVLAQIGQRMTDLVGMGGVVARLGGDEFVVALPDVTGTDQAITFAHRVSTEIALPIRWGDRILKTTASVGIALTGDCTNAPEAEVSALCSAADQAMFAAKTSPSRVPRLYKKCDFVPRMTSTEKQDLIDAINDRRIKPFYQPKVLLSSGQIIGFEALARWEDRDGKVRAPASFLDQIGELGLEGDFMAQMAHQVFEDVARMCDDGLDPGQVSLNVPEVALATYTGRHELHRIVAAHASIAKHITFEITEDVFIARAAATIQGSIAGFRALGVRISLDDFGTGFASFHHLRELDFDEMKIDKSFIAGLGEDSSAEVLVSGFLNIASGLGVSVIAEGVETEDQRRDLINMGCICAQGYLFGKARPICETVKQLAAQQAA